VNPARPNFLIFMTDQQRGDSILGGQPCRTPVLDRFRQDAVTFTSAFCPSPHCCPARATFFTGLYPSEHGVWHNVSVANAITRGLADGVQLWSSDLAAAGYDLAFSGKWHVSALQRPADHGWSERGVTGAHETPVTNSSAIEARWDRFRDGGEQAPGGIRRAGEILRPGYAPYVHYGVHEDPFHDAQVVGNAVQALEERRGSPRPWAHYVGTLGPHDPYHAPSRFLDLHPIEEIELPESFADRMEDKPAFYRRTRAFFDQLDEEEHRQAIRHYLAFCSYEDELFGRVLDALEATGQSENTVVMFLSDHGDYMADHGLWCKGLPAFRGAYHVPAVVRWPAGLLDPGRNVDRMISLADFAPTILDLAGIEADRVFSGRSLVPFLQNRRPRRWRTTLFTQTNGNELYGIQRSVFTERWKYVFNGFDYDELYDLREDPGETRNLSADPELMPTVEALCRKMWRFVYDHHDACINPYIMTGFGPVGPGVVFEEDPEVPSSI
jgi:arylsulfatase A-like enzyme